VETNAISYRVADFLKKHPPFHAIDEADLVALADRGRVRFYEAEDFLLWQGEPHRAHVFVIQQGTVSLWDEANGRSVLCDILGVPCIVVRGGSNKPQANGKDDDQSGYQGYRHLSPIAAKDAALFGVHLIKYL